MSDTNTPKPTPNRKLSIMIDEKPYELFMSWGLLDEFLNHFGPTTGNGIENALFDGEHRQFVVEKALSANGKYGVPNFDYKTSEIDVDTIVEVSQWVMAHVLDFFLRSGEAAQNVVTENKSRITSLEPSATGSPA